MKRTPILSTILILLLHVNCISDYPSDFSYDYASDFPEDYKIQPSEGSWIQPWKGNPWYWQYKEKPVLLLGASNDDNLFQWPKDILIPHLDSMRNIGVNYARNTMSDRNDKGFELYAFLQLKDGKYDLDQWNEEYWNRFDFFLKETAKREIIVQIEVWDRFDVWDKYWLPHPFNPANNVNYTSILSGLELVYPLHPASNMQPFFFTPPGLKNNVVLLNYQQRFVEKMLSYSLKYDHILYCMDNETSAEEAWGAYWAEFIREKAAEKDKSIYITEMWDDRNLKSDHQKRTFDHQERYAFCDISQNTWQDGQVLWDNFQWVRDYLSLHPRPINVVKTYMRNNKGIESWWKHVIGGVASSRFHRPTSGWGLSAPSAASVKAVRKIESVVKFWELTPGNDLLSMRDENEAYLTSKAGEFYVIYFTNGGAVGLDLQTFSSKFKLKWLEVHSGVWISEQSIAGGKIVEINAPGVGGWVAVISKN